MIVYSALFLIFYISYMTLWNMAREAEKEAADLWREI